MRSDAGLLQAFEDCSLPEDEFRHATHIRVAWLYLQHLELPTAIQTLTLLANLFPCTFIDVSEQNFQILPRQTFRHFGVRQQSQPL